ncbi:MAG: CRTAC1 family protein [Deltaproteobacteria bacterium]|nr:CRTAC1 family protein [Nannocystaceae bacterium]
MELTFDLDGVPLGEPDEHIFAEDPIGVWRVPLDTPLGDATLYVRWADDPDSAAEIPLEITAPRFVDVAEPTGLAQTHDATGSPAECAESHTGVAMGDYDGDALPDVYVGNVGTSGRLFRNLGNIDADSEPDFVDVTDDAGLGGVDSVAMATFVDLEGDGDQDLFIGRRGTNRMFENRRVPDGTPTYVDVTAALGLDLDSQRTMGVAFGDYDGDEDLDLYEVNHAFCYPEPGFEIRAEDHLYRNDGGVFFEHTNELSPSAGNSVGFSAAWVDLERDGDQDLIVINDDVGGDIGDPNEVWRNDGQGDTGAWTFTDVSLSSGLGDGSWHGMGIALGDVDGDGFVDVAFSNIRENVLMLNQGDGTFEDVSAAAGIERAEFPWGRDSITWATHLWDHDNDGDLDLYFSGGTLQATGPVSDAFFDNVGDVDFVDLTWESALADPAHGKASALGDFDRDGAWDLVTAAWSDELRVWRNLAIGNHYLDIELVGRAGNRDGLGAIVELTTDVGTQTCFHTQRPSLGAGGETACHFGLGSETEITTLRIFWPDGTIQDVTPPAVDQRVAFTQPPA